MKPKEPSEQPRTLIAATVLAMLLSVSLMLVLGLASNFASPAPTHPPAPAISHSLHAGQGSQLGALRGRLTRWVAYLARSG